MGTRTESWGVLVGLPNGQIWDGRGPIPEYLALAAIPQHLGKFAPTQDIEIRWSSLVLGRIQGKHQNHLAGRPNDHPRKKTGPNRERGLLATG